MHLNPFEIAFGAFVRWHCFAAAGPALSSPIRSSWRALCNAGLMKALHFLFDKRTCPRLSRIGLAAALMACIPVGSLAQNGTIQFFGLVGTRQVVTIAAFTDAALLPLSGLSGKIAVEDASGFPIAYERPAIAPGHVLVALTGEPVQEFRICAGSGCRVVRVVRGDR